MKKILSILTIVVLLTAGTYGTWYSYNREARIEQGKKCNNELASPKQMPGPDGALAFVYSIDTCITIVVPPPLWDLVRGRMTFQGVPNRMKVNPYSFADMLLGRYTLGPDIGMPCDPSATTTDCSAFLAPL